MYDIIPMPTSRTWRRDSELCYYADQVRSGRETAWAFYRETRGHSQGELAMRVGREMQMRHHRGFIDGLTAVLAALLTREMHRAEA